MIELYDLNAPKKPTNLSINSDLLRKSRSLNVNLSATLEQALKKQLQSKEADIWKTENKAAMKKYNEFVAENGNLSDEFRTF